MSIGTTKIELLKKTLLFMQFLNLQKLIIQKVYTSEKPIRITGTDEILLKYDFIEGIIVNGTRPTISYSFAVDKPPGQNILTDLEQNFTKNKGASFEENRV